MDTRGNHKVDSGGIVFKTSQIRKKNRKLENHC